MERYSRTLGALTAEELSMLHKKSVCVVGCGGLGGYILEMLARIGVLNISFADGDVFTESNLNRQLLCTEKNIGVLKAKAAEERIKKINSNVTFSSRVEFITEENVEQFLLGHDVIVDALDNVSSRLLLERFAEILKIPLVHGAMQDWVAHVAVVRPGDKTLSKFYSSFKTPPPAVPSFTPAFCASVQVSETVKLLCGKETLQSGQMLIFDLYDNSMNVITV